MRIYRLNIFFYRFDRQENNQGLAGLNFVNGAQQALVQISFD